MWYLAVSIDKNSWSQIAFHTIDACSEWLWPNVICVSICNSSPSSVPCVISSHHLICYDTCIFFMSHYHRVLCWEIYVLIFWYWARNRTIDFGCFFIEIAFRCFFKTSVDIRNLQSFHFIKCKKDDTIDARRDIQLNFFRPHWNNNDTFAIFIA